jgi:trans-aconitate methyltransferase
MWRNCMTIVRDKAFWQQYLSERTGTYEFRCRRYAAVLDVLCVMGFSTTDSLCDVGCGAQEFEKFCREQGWTGEYTAVDGSIDGTDLDVWLPERTFDWMIAIEVIEHLHDPHRMLQTLRQHSVKGSAVTTPNPEVVDVLAIDRTHVSIVYPSDLANAGFVWVRDTLFSSDEFRKRNDSLIGWHRHE